MEMNKLMAIHVKDDTNEDILGKFLYYSLPKLMVDKQRLLRLSEALGFPISLRENASQIDAFRSATGDVNDRIVEKVGGETNILRIYFRDNKKVDENILSRELVEETLEADTNQYRKLANMQFDKTSKTLRTTDIDWTSSRNVDLYCERAKEYFELYQNCAGNRQIQTVIEKYIDGMSAIKISARGHHFFVPKAQMHKLDLLEDFIGELGNINQFRPVDKNDKNFISVNSMYVADDEKQRTKMAAEFYVDIGKQIRDYQDRIEHLIKSGSESEAILNRWILKVNSLEQKKKQYEDVLKQNLNGMDEEFELLKTLCLEYKSRVNSKGLYQAA